MLPIVVIGGGPVGLVSSILLSMHGIQHTVFEQFPGTSIHPKACGLNQRTIEIFRQLGVEEDVKKHRAPLTSVSRTAWYTSLGPDGREVYGREAWGGGEYVDEYKRASPAQYSMLAQIRLEPILQKRALELNSDAIRYNTKVTKVEEKSDRVILTVEKKDGSQEQVHASYVLGADGGRGLAESIGIDWQGEQDIVDMVTAHFKADLTSVHPDKRVFISWIMNPKLKGSLGGGYLYHLGPYYPSWQTKAEWVYAAPRHPDDPEKFDSQSMVQRIKRSLELPDLDVELMSLSHWMVNSRVSEHYRSEGGRIFLVGDACHRVPPWGALGMNTGIQDAHNLIWKLALAVKAETPESYDALLDTYQEERQPIAQRVATNSLHNMRNHSNIMDSAVGITAETTTEDNLRALHKYFDPTHPEHPAKRDAVKKAGELLDLEFHAPGIEIGWFYPTADISDEGKESRHDGQLLENGSLNITKYHPSTVPGHNLPHAWLQRQGEMTSTRDLVKLDRFVLLTQTAGIWDKAKSELMDIEVIDGETNWTDREGMWAEFCGTDKTGAVLVRPDGIVAWRAKTFDSQAPSDLPALIRKILKQDKSEA
ncbi:hypothetical protein H2204_014752 [Knufia peltigerae]|uniref:FAD-binding domain-containing protein n=1 Tax=Knufia peltigerae TaxID=1002370 RepID=A0AA38XHU2_9EURO|nr:hypothetical protein H2204_014752 [Knufia peltigerae]